MIPQKLAAQVNLNSLDGYSQDFNTLPRSGSGTWQNNITLPGWYVLSGNSTPATLSANTGSVRNAGLYSFGIQGDTDRALGGFAASKTSFLTYGLRLKNNTGSTIRSITVSFTLEQWYLSRVSSEKLIFSYTTNTNLTSLSSGSWKEVAGLTASSPATGSVGTRNGNLPANQVQLTATLNDVALASGQEIFFKWQDARPSNNSEDHGLGIDEVTITPSSNLTFYSGKNGALNNLDTWGTNPDGSGMRPVNFTAANQIFQIQNNSTPVLNANWVVSGNNSKVVLGNDSQPVSFTINSNYAFRGVIDVNNEATLTLSHTTLPVLGSIAPNSTVILNTAGNQVLTANYFGNLTLSGTGIKSLSANTTISGQLTLNGSKLQLDNYNLRIAETGSITGGSEASFILTNGSGALELMVQANGRAVLFPIGNPTYTPAALTQAPAGTTDFFSARAFKGAYAAYDLEDSPIGNPLTEKAIDRTWIINEETEGGSNITLSLYWTQAEALPLYKLENNQVSHCDKGMWNKGQAKAAVKNGGLYMNSMSNINTFSPFISNNPEMALMSMGTLPIEMLAFTGAWQQQQVWLKWSTATEHDNDFFTVQVSEDGHTFREAGQVKGAGNSQTLRHYSFAYRPQNRSTTYYRLKQTDFNGAVTYSKIVAIAGYQPAGATLNVFPNPGNGIFHINTQGAVPPVQIMVTDLSGKTILPAQAFHAPDGQGTLDLSHQAPGVYLLTLSFSDARQVLRLVKK